MRSRAFLWQAWVMTDLGNLGGTTVFPYDLSGDRVAAGEAMLPSGQMHAFVSRYVCEDADNDRWCDQDDNCPTTPNSTQDDRDGDRIGDVCDACPWDGENDADDDGLCADSDLCPYDAENDADADGFCHSEDICPYDPLDDVDGAVRALDLAHPSHRTTLTSTAGR